MSDAKLPEAPPPYTPIPDDPESGTPSPPPPPRKMTFRRVVACVFIFLFTSWMIAPALEGCHVGGGGGGHRRRPQDVEHRALKILRHSPLIDGHNDFPIFIRAFFNNHIYSSNFSTPFENGTLLGHVDLERLRTGHSGGAFWSVFVPCPSSDSNDSLKDEDEFADTLYDEAVRTTFQQIDLVDRLRTLYPSDFAPSTLTSAAAAHAFRHHRQLISPLGVEGLHQIGNSAANLRLFYALGVRYATLTHNCHNRFADAALLENPTRVAEPRWGGVSPEGRNMVAEMNRIGMIVDLAHVSEDTMIDVLGGNDWPGSAAPIIFSHSSAYAICPHPRNVKDHVLDLVKARNSVVMVNFSPDFIACTAAEHSNGLPDPDPANATLAQVVRHIMHIGTRIGFDHVGIGSDFDGIATTPKGLEDVSRFPDLVAELLRQGVSDKDAAKVVGRNVLRVWKDVEATARRLQKEGVPVLEDNVPDMF